MSFESLGDNCELGLLQRRVGFERLSLFRYAGSPSIDTLIEAIEADFLGFATADDLAMEHFHDMWDARSRRYGFQIHTYIYRDKMDEDVSRAAEGTKLRFMASLLSESFETAHKIFVRRGPEDKDDRIRVCTMPCEGRVLIGSYSSRRRLKTGLMASSSASTKVYIAVS